MASEKLEIIISAKDQASGAIGKVTGSLGKLGGLAVKGLAVGMAAGGAALAGVGAAAIKLASDAAPLAGVQDAFEGISESAGKSADDMLAALQKGSAGMVTNRDLMTSFNKAASLVSKDFAVQLPDAMSYLGKVSQATGQDMNFLMDSLVTGVGRMSPMILDNLGIQVSLAEATEEASLMFGVEADELTKAQQQAGLMNVVMGKLADTTADIPDVADSAQQKFASFQTTLANVKDEIGLALLPAVTPLMKGLGDLAAKILPKVVKAIEPFAKNIGKLIGILFDSGPASKEFKDALTGMIGEDATNFITTVVDKLGELYNWLSIWVPIAIQVASDYWSNVLWPALQNIWNFISENIIPIIAEVVQWLADNLPVAIQAAAEFWETTLQPALQAVWEFISTKVIPVIQDIVAWLSDNIPVAIQTASDFWNNTLKPALETVWNFISENIVPIFETVVEWLQDNIPPAIEALADLWENKLKPALETVWNFIDENIIPIFETVAEIAEITLGLALEVLAGIWENTLQPALETVWEWLSENILPIFENIRDFIAEHLGPKIEWLTNSVISPLSGALDTVAGWLSTFHEWLITVRDLLLTIELPDWLKMDSPPPLATALSMISDELKKLNTEDLPVLKNQLATMPDASFSLTSRGYGMSARGTTNYNNNQRRSTVVNIQNTAAMALYMEQMRQDEMDQIGAVI